MFDNLKNLAGSVLPDLMNLTDLDDKALAMLEEKFGKEKVDEIKQAISDGKIDMNDLENVAEKFGVPKMVIELLIKYIQK